MATEPDKNPFVGPRSLEPRDGIYGRDDEIRELCWFFTAERIVWLHSPSGAGKTSLVQAGLIPKMEQRNFDVLPIARVSRETGAGGNRYESSVLSSLGATANLRDFLAATGKGKCRALIFDQFEEVLTLDATDVEAKGAFFESLGRALQLPDVWALFVLREDFLPAMDPYVRYIPTLMNHRFRLDLLSVDCAQEAMKQIAGRGGREFSAEALRILGPELAKVLVQSGDREEWKAGRVVEPVILQVVCRSMWEAIPSTDSTIEPKHVPTGEKVRKSLADFYATCVQSVSGTIAEERAVRTWVGEKLITAGFRNQVLDARKDGAGLGAKLVAALAKTHLIRREDRGERTWYELQHDRLVAPVLADNKRWAEEHLHWVQRRAELWNQQGRNKASLLLNEDLKKAEQWIEQSRPELTEVENKFLDQSRAEQKARDKIRLRTRLAWFAACVSTALCLVATYFYLGARSRELTNMALIEVRGDQPGCAVADGSAALDLAQYLGPALRDSAMEALSEALQAGQAPYEFGPAELRIAFSPAADRLVAASDSQVNVYQANTRDPKTWKVDDGCKITGLALRPDGKQMALGLDNGVMVRVTIPGGGEKISCGTPPDSGWSIEALAFSSTGELASAHALDGASRIEIDGKEISQLPAVGLAFRPDGQSLAAGLTDGSVRILDLNGSEKRKLLYGDSAVNGIAWAPNTLAAVSTDADALRVWDDEGNFKVSENGQPLGGNAGVALSPDGSLMVILGLADNQAKVWNMASRKLWLTLRTPPAQEAKLTGALFKDERWLMVAYKKGKARLFALDAAGLKQEAGLFHQPCARKP